MAKNKEYPLGAILSIMFGILVIAFDDLLVWLVGLYLIINGVLRLIR